MKRLVAIIIGIAVVGLIVYAIHSNRERPMCAAPNLNSHMCDRWEQA